MSGAVPIVLLSVAVRPAPPTGEAIEGQGVRVHVTARDGTTRQPVAVTGLRVLVRPPRSTVPIAYDQAQLTAVRAGEWALDLVLDRSARWRVRAECTAPRPAVAETMYEVRLSGVVQPEPPDTLLVTEAGEVISTPDGAALTAKRLDRLPLLTPVQADDTLAVVRGDTAGRLTYGALRDAATADAAAAAEVAAVAPAQQAGAAAGAAAGLAAAEPERVAAEAARVAAEAAQAGVQAEAARAAAAADSTAQAVANAAVQRETLAQLNLVVGVTGQLGIVYGANPGRGQYRWLAGAWTYESPTVTDIHAQGLQTRADLQRGEVTLGRTAGGAAGIEIDGRGQPIVSVVARGQRRGAVVVDEDGAALQRLDTLAYALSLPEFTLRVRSLDGGVAPSSLAGDAATDVVIDAGRALQSVPPGTPTAWGLLAGEEVAARLDTLRQRLVLTGAYGVSVGTDAAIGRNLGVAWDAAVSGGLAAAGGASEPAVVQSGQWVQQVAPGYPTAWGVMVGETLAARVDGLRLRFEVMSGFSLAAETVIAGQVETPRAVLGGATEDAHAERARTFLTAGPGARGGGILGASGPLLLVDSENETLRAPLPRGEAWMARDALVSRGGAVCLRDGRRPPSLDSVSVPAVWSTDPGLATNTHQMIPAVAVTNRGRWWVAFFAAQSPLGPGTFGEVNGSYLMLRYSDDQGDTWQVAPYLLPADMVNTRIGDTYLHYDAPTGCLWIQYWQARPPSFSAAYDRIGALWAVAIANPDAAGRFVSSRHFYLDHGVGNKVFYVDGHPATAHSYWQDYDPSRTRGKWYARMGFNGPDGPWLERISQIPRVPGFDEFDETSIVQLDDGSLYAEWRTTAGIHWSHSADHLTWSAPQPWTAYAAPVSRHVLIRTPKGRLLRVFNNATGRNRMAAQVNTVPITPANANIAASWTTPLVFFATDSSYPNVDFDPVTGRAVVVWDDGRGSRGTGVKNIWAVSLDEDALAAGNATATLKLVAS